MIPNMSGLAALVQSIGSDTFNQQFFDFSRNQWQADQCTIFRLHGEAPPQCLLAEAEQRKTRKAMLEVVQEYTGGAYQRDPNLTTLQHNGFGEGQCRVSCVAPKQIVDIAYRRRFYETLDAAQEMALITELQGQRYYFSFVRSRSQPLNPLFSANDTQQLHHMSLLLAQIYGKHSSIMGTRLQEESCVQLASVPTPERREFIRQQLHEILLNDPGKLTPREAQICALIAVGYTSLGIGLMLDVSINTVGTHRKRAYAKLKISSQSELFSRYVERAGLHT